MTTQPDWYGPIIAAAELIVEKYGREFTLTNNAPTAPADPTQPWLESPPTVTTVTLWGAFTAYERKLIDNTTIKATDKKLIFVDYAANPQGVRSSQITWEVSTADVVAELNGQQYIIVDVKITAPGPTKAVYELQLRVG